VLLVEVVELAVDVELVEAVELFVVLVEEARASEVIVRSRLVVDVFEALSVMVKVIVKAPTRVASILAGIDPPFITTDPASVSVTKVMYLDILVLLYLMPIDVILSDYLSVIFGKVRS
jgi:uncharacterized protein (DUF2126 family)